MALTMNVSITVDVPLHKDIIAYCAEHDCTHQQFLLLACEKFIADVKENKGWESYEQGVKRKEET